MIIRFWLVFGFVLVTLAWVLQVPLAPEPFQASARSAITEYREAGLMPPAGSLPMSEEIGHDVFEVPATDAEHQNEEQAAAMPGMAGGGQPMAGMEKNGDEHGAAMPGMAGGGQPMAGMESKADEHGAAMPGMAGGGQPMAGMESKTDEHGTAMPGMAGMESQTDEHGTAMPGMAGMESQTDEHGTTMPGMAGMESQPDEHGTTMPGMAGMESKADEHGATGEAQEGGHGGGGGIELIAAGAAPRIDRTIELEMTEWGFNPGSITVKHGQIIRLVVTNAGNTPHEFMLMTAAAMNAVKYRIGRADWNLTEHEAIYEHSIAMPGDRFEKLLRIDKPGMWMFMCMFPYHMRLGMMGSMATEGMGGMNMGGGMKM
jgi:uncharacterized cupredoxin-like copper-binding protein